MKQFKIKSFFIKEGLKTSNPDSWKDYIITNDNIIKQTEKAVFVQNTKTNETVWIPKACLKPIADEENFKPVPFPSSNDIPNPLEATFANTSSTGVDTTLPDEVKSIFAKCETCGCINNGKCTMYNLATHFALLLCMQNDLDAANNELEVSNYRISELEEKVLSLDGEI